MRGPYIQLSFLKGAYRNLKRAVTHIYKGNISWLLILSRQVLLVNAIGQGSSCRIVEKTEAIQSCNGTGVQKSPALSICEKRWNLGEGEIWQFTKTQRSKRLNHKIPK